jgi:hypothetical protein
MLKRSMILVSMLGLLMPVLSEPSEPTVDTASLIVADATGGLSNEQLKQLADQSQVTLDSILAFWSADPGVGRFGKIRVYFDKPRREIYSCVFYWEQEGNQRIRIVRVFGFQGTPQMMAHKLTSAIFPQKDKLIRNMMGILAEAQVGNPLTFPRCGCSSDEWVLALLRTKSYIPLDELGPDHESWGMEDAGGGMLSVHDKGKQHAAYAEAGSFGNYLFQTYGVNKIKLFQRRSQEKDRPWREAFGADLPQLEANWLNALRASEKARAENVTTVLKLLEKNPGTACVEAQKLPHKTR